MWIGPYVIIITQIINKSIDEGTVSENVKNTILKPLLEKQGLALTFGNNHLVSNLSYILKLLEKVVSTQLMDLAETSDNMKPYQSTYHSGHSTETAVLWAKLISPGSLTTNKSPVLYCWIWVQHLRPYIMRLCSIV